MTKISGIDSKIISQQDQSSGSIKNLWVLVFALQLHNTIADMKEKKFDIEYQGSRALQYKEINEQLNEVQAQLDKYISGKGPRGHLKKQDIVLKPDDNGFSFEQQQAIQRLQGKQTELLLKGQSFGQAIEQKWDVSKKINAQRFATNMQIALKQVSVIAHLLRGL